MRTARLSRPFSPGLVLSALALVGSFGLACNDKPKELPTAPVVLAAVVEPAGLAAEVFIPKPGTLWTKAKNLGGDKLAFLPASFPMALAAVLGLPPGAIESIEADSPAYGAAIIEDGKELPVLAVHLRNGPKLVATLTLGSQAKFVKKVDEPSGVVLLEPAPSESSLNAALGVVGDYLLIGYAPDGLLKLGPYVARNLPKRPTPSEDVVVNAKGAALAGPLLALMTSKWVQTRENLLSSDKQERERRGSAPTYGDPSALVARVDESVQTGLRVIGNLASARASLALDAAGGHLRVVGTPAPEDGVARNEVRALRTGSAEAVLDLPDDVVLALHRRDDPAEREKDAKAQAEVIDKVLGEKLGTGGRSKLEATLVSWGKGRGEALALGVAINRSHASVLATFPVDDPAEATAAIRGLLELPKVPGIAEPLKRWLGDIKVGALPVATENAGVVKIERKPVPPTGKELALKDASGREVAPKATKQATAPALETTQLAYQLGEKGSPGAVVYGKEGKDQLSRIGKEGLTLKSDADVKSAVDKLGTDVSHVAVLLPSRLVSAFAMRGMVDPSKIPSAPIVISLGRAGKDAVLRVDAHPIALREMAKIQQLKLP